MRAVLARALPEGYAPIPSLAGARSRQLSLSKIVPYDFVEPSIDECWESLCRAIYDAIVSREMALPEGFEPSYQP